jgi:hypothetical protein
VKEPSIPTQVVYRGYGFYKGVFFALGMLGLGGILGNLALLHFPDKVGPIVAFISQFLFSRLPIAAVEARRSAE